MTDASNDGRATQTIRLRYTRPFDWAGMFAFFRVRAIPGLEELGSNAYRRTVTLGGAAGILTIRDDAAAGELVADVDSDAAFPETAIADRLRRFLDLDADLAAVTRHLAQDPLLARLIAERAAVRIPGFWDPYETAIRAVLGQQVSLAAARVLVARLIDRASPRIENPVWGRLHRLFPTPAQVLAADLSSMGMPGSRVQTLRAVSNASLADPELFRRGASVDETVQRLQAIKGIGPWSAHYIALRACREPDAFPASDVGLLRGMAVEGRRPTAAELGQRAEAWRPFRAYAAHHIWASDPGSSLPASTPSRAVPDQ